MKKTILFTLLSLFVLSGCESHQHDSVQQQQEKQQLNDGNHVVKPNPVSEHEGGGNQGNK
jgi:uncharacterized protein YcfL